MSMKDKVIETGRTVTAARIGQPAAARELVYSTREIHRQLVAGRVFVDDKQKQDGWKLLAKLVEYEYPGVRRGAETQSAWKGNKRLVRPLEWHHTPTPEEMTAWEAKVQAHKGAGPVADIAERLAQLDGQVVSLRGITERLEKQVADLTQTAHNIGRTA